MGFRIKSGVVLVGGIYGLVVSIAHLAKSPSANWFAGLACSLALIVLGAMWIRGKKQP